MLARPALRGVKSRSPNFDSAHAELISQVKCAQRHSPELKEMWHTYCDTEANGNRDPGRHSESFLQAFVAQAREADPSLSLPSLHFETEEKQALVLQVKRLQVTSQEDKDYWHEYCDADGGGIRDPTRHDVAFLLEFLNRIGVDALAYDESALVHDEVTWPKSGGAPEALISEVKSVQRHSTELRDMWHDHCDTRGSGIRDPGRHSESFLQEFLTQVQATDTSISWPSTQVETAEKGALISQVKRLQVSSKEAKDQWHEYCDTEGGGSRDPARHNVAFIREFLRRMGEQDDVHVQPAPDQRLVEEVKAMQKSDESYKIMWHEFCDTGLAGVRDPARHDSATLRRFLSSLPSVPPVTATKPSAPSALVDKVKQAQKTSTEWKDKWHQHCDSEGGGVRDPAKHTAAFLTRFLSSIGFAAAAKLPAAGFVVGARPAAAGVNKPNGPVGGRPIVPAKRPLGWVHVPAAKRR
mmetsp:Transcript_106946/g.300747  ORF Transcript_106946/g.300747 Transcript_106946/m.300747 type:complete len:467 (-) Transcript_106946:94-1494(-)